MFAYEKYAILADHIELIFARNDFFIAMATYLQLTFNNSSFKEIEICSSYRAVFLSDYRTRELKIRSEQGMFEFSEVELANAD